MERHITLIKWSISVLAILGMCFIFTWTTGITIKKQGEIELSTPMPDIARHVDEEAGVVCYLAEMGIDCLPIGDTWLGDDGR